MNASTNQLNAILKKVDGRAEEVVATENTIDETLINIIEVQDCSTQLKYCQKKQLKKKLMRVPTKEITMKTFPTI